MNEVIISKKYVLVGLLLISLCAGVVLGIPLLQRFLPDQEAAQVSITTAQTNASDDDQLAQVAALAGAQAFYTVDYQAQQDWVEKLCAISTEIGCAVNRNTLAPILWVDFAGSQTKTTVQASTGEKVLDETLPSRGNASAQVWQVQIELSAPWPQQSQPLTQFQALALVIEEQGGWKFERFLTEEESRVYEKGSQP